MAITYWTWVGDLHGRPMAFNGLHAPTRPVEAGAAGARAWAMGGVPARARGMDRTFDAAEPGDGCERFSLRLAVVERQRAVARAAGHLAYRVFLAMLGNACSYCRRWTLPSSPPLARTIN